MIKMKKTCGDWNEKKSYSAIKKGSFSYFSKEDK